MSNRLYRFLKITAFLGTVLPLLTCLLKVCADDFLVWKRVKREIPQAQQLVQDFPFLDLEQYGFLSALSWHKSYGLHVFEYYIRYAVFSALVLVLIHTYRRRIKGYLDRLAAWVAISDQGRIRKLFVAVGCLLFFAYMTKAPIGFYWPGVSGWTEENKIKRMVATLPDSVQQIGPVPAFIEKSIKKDVVKTPYNIGFLQGRSQFLHFSDGQVLPFNDGLTGYIFPRYQFGKTLQTFTRKDVFFTSVKHGLNTVGKGRPFILPNVISYPRHTVYMTIDYEDYPGPEALEMISFWEVWIEVKPSGEVQPVAARQELALYEKDHR